jgi:hypothetical protein
VWIGADKTARVMWFLDGQQTSDVDRTVRRAPAIIIKDRTIAIKTASVAKVSEIEKEIPGGFAHEIRLRSFTEPSIDDALLEHSADTYGLKSLLSTLSSLGIVLKPEEFQKLVVASKPMGNRINAALEKRSAVFDTDVSAIADDYVVKEANVDLALAEIMSPLAPLRSSFAPHLGPRMEGLRGPMVKMASPIRTDFLDEVAAQYNGYRISVLEQAPYIFPKYSAAVALSGEDMIKASSAGLAPLLLGLGPMVHLISSHLRGKQQQGGELGAVSNFVSKNPTFTGMMTIGAGLRAAMGVQALGGIGAVAAKVLGIVAKNVLGGGRLPGTIASITQRVSR